MVLAATATDSRDDRVPEGHQLDDESLRARVRTGTEGDAFTGPSGVARPPDRGGGWSTRAGADQPLQISARASAWLELVLGERRCRVVAVPGSGSPARKIRGPDQGVRLMSAWRASGTINPCSATRSSPSTNSSETASSAPR